MILLTHETTKLATLPAVRLECSQKLKIDERAKSLKMSISDYVRYCINIEMDRGVNSAEEN